MDCSRWSLLYADQAERFALGDLKPVAFTAPMSNAPP
jgi:hypothetical protein